MNLYLAGPMTGYPELNRPAFEAAQRRLQRNGHFVTTPFELNEQVWAARYGRSRPLTMHDQEGLKYGDPMVNAFILRDIEFIAWADGVALLPGWERSRGSKLEILVANLMDKPIYDARTMHRLNIDAEVHVGRSPGAIQLELGV